MLKHPLPQHGINPVGVNPIGHARDKTLFVRVLSGIGNGFPLQFDKLGRIEELWAFDDLGDTPLYVGGDGRLVVPASLGSDDNHTIGPS